MSVNPLVRLLTVTHPDHDVQRRAQLLVLVDLIMLGFFVIASLLLLFQPGQRTAIATLCVLLLILSSSLLLTKCCPSSARLTAGDYRPFRPAP